MDSSTAINWRVVRPDTIFEHPIYLKYSAQVFNSIDASVVKTDIKAALASNESADLVAYLSWILRTLALIG